MHGTGFGFYPIFSLCNLRNTSYCQHKETAIGVNMDGGKEWLEAVVKRKAYEDSPVKVVEIETSDSGIGKGENYLSKIGRVKAKVLLGSGKVKTMSFIVKNEHETEHMKKFSLETGVFFREITMYRDILPKMQNVLEEIGDPEDIFWAKCYDIRLYNRLMFEDLGVLGYKMADRKKQLGLEASLLVIKHLAKFHALSRILIDRGEIPMGLFGKHVLIKNREEFIKYMDINVTNLIKTMEKWGEEWKEAIERFKKAENFSERVFDAYTVDPNEFTVLNHGDCWTNNLMFAGDDLEHPKSMKIIDWQICFIASPIRDISYFLTSSVRADVLNNNLELFLKTYADSLGSYLAKFGYECAVPDYESVKKDLKKREIWLISDGIGVVPWMLTNQDNVPDIEGNAEKLKKKQEEKIDAVVPLHNLFESLDGVAKCIVQALIKRALHLKVI